MTTKEEKKTLRVLMHQQRKALDPVKKLAYDRWICAEILTLIHTQNFRTIHAYIPLKGEIDIKPLLSNLLSKKITVICPKTLKKRNLENRVLVSLQDLEVGIMGTEHPLQPTIYNGSFDLIIVPGLAFDKENYRLGYGGGYYDNFLASHTGSYKLGIFYPFQEVNSVPIESHDIKLDRILVKEF